MRQGSRATVALCGLLLAAVSSFPGCSGTKGPPLITSQGSFPVGEGPTSIAIDSSGNVWVTNKSSANSEVGGSTISKLSSGGAPLGTFSVGNTPWGIAIDSADNVWVTNEADNTVVKLNNAGELQVTVSVDENPEGIAIDGAGNVWVVAGPTVDKVSNAGVKLGSFRLGTILVAIAIDAADNVWVTSANNNSVIEVGNDGTPLLTVNAGVLPNGLAFDSVGNLWVANTGQEGGAVTKLSSTGETLGTFPLSYSVVALAIDSQDNVWAVGGGLGNKLNSAGVTVGTFVSGVTFPTGLAIDPNRPLLWAASGTNTIQRFSTGGPVGLDVVPRDAGSPDSGD